MDYDFDEVDTLYGWRLVGSSRLPERSCQLVIDSNFTLVSGFQFPSHFGWQDGTNYQVGFSVRVSSELTGGGHVDEFQVKIMEGFLAIKSVRYLACPVSSKCPVSSRSEEGVKKLKN